MSESATKPCPKCAKPLRPDAANCWFCGMVFGIVRCVECGSPNRTGSPACQICGEPLPSSPLLVAASDAPPTAPRASEQDCPGCGGPVPLAAIQCKHCGTALAGPTGRWSKGNERPLARSRGGSLIALGVLSVIWLAGIFTPGLMFVLLGVKDALVLFALSASVGVGLAVLGLILAMSDLAAMDNGDRNPDGRTSTTVAGWLGGVSILLYMIVFGVFLALAK